MVTATEAAPAAIVAVPVCFLKSSAANTEVFPIVITTPKEKAIKKVFIGDIKSNFSEHT
jgi:hypothetical protein